MDNFDKWEDVSTSKIPLPHENFDDYFTEFHEIDNLFNETLTGLQDLDVPSGYIQPTLNLSPIHKHSRKASGTAIFGFADHTRELSIGGMTSDLYKSIKPSMDLGKSISPGDLLKSINGQNIDPISYEDPPLSKFDFPPQKPILLLEEDEDEEEESLAHNDKSVPDKSVHLDHHFAQLSPIKKNLDYVTANPTSYKFPPSPSPTRLNSTPIKIPQNSGYQSVNNYSVKYLQNLNQNKLLVKYVDDIGPLLDKQLEIGDFEEIQRPQKNNQNHQNQQNYRPQKQQDSPQRQYQQLPSHQPNPFTTSYKYVPIPVQKPTYTKNEVYENQQFQQYQQHIPQQQPQQPQPSLSQIQQLSQHYLPPPSPPTLSAGSPDWQSSPEPQSPSPSRAQLNSSPINLRPGNVNFYTPQFFSEADLQYEQDPFSQTYNNQSYNNQSPFNQTPFNLSPLHSQQLASSPVKYSSNSSPLRQIPDETFDANATITQLTPLKKTLPSTPSRNNIRLEWSPIISPNAKASKDVKRHIQESSVRRIIKKTSLLPPGELDQYWVGPDEEKIYTCTYKNCGKKFTRRYNVRSHIQTHLSDRPFACSRCPKRFVRQHDLNRHVKGHMEARSCKCVCGKEFARIDALKKHQIRKICARGVTGVASGVSGGGVTKPVSSKGKSFT